MLNATPDPSMLKTFAIHVPGGQVFTAVGVLGWTTGLEAMTSLRIQLEDGRVMSLDPRNVVIDVEYVKDRAVGGIIAYHPRRDGHFVGEWATWMDDNLTWPDSVLMPAEPEKKEDLR